MLCQGIVCFFSFLSIPENSYYFITGMVIVGHDGGDDPDKYSESNYFFRTHKYMRTFNFDIFF